MKKLLLTIAVVMGLWLLATLAQEQSIPFGSKIPSKVMTEFHLNGRCECTLNSSNILSTPDWSAVEPLPLSISNAVEIARGELRQLTTDEHLWRVEKVWIKSLMGTDAKKWYFLFEFDRTPRQALDPPMVLVDFAGRPGTIVRKK
jgi:hypothetical protein